MVRLITATCLILLVEGCGFIPYNGDDAVPIDRAQVVFDSLGSAIGAFDRPCGSLEARYSPGRDRGELDRWRNATHPNARWLTQHDLHNNAFVGIAISGGGSRSANFAIATLLELEELGVLKHVSAISSVSGGSLAAAYYGLFGKDPNKWNPEALKKLFRTNLEWKGLATWLWPPNLILTGLTEYTRTQVMGEVMNGVFFENKAFSDFDPALPVVLINATELSQGGCQFTFTAENFNAMRLNLAQYPIANAVMASGAFPGAFNPITISNWASPSTSSWFGITRPTYHRHFYDGGPSDNLGTDTLAREVIRLQEFGEKVNECFIFVIDAYTDPFFPFDKPQTRDTRSAVDFFIDTNALSASDVLLSKARSNQLQEMGIANPISQSIYRPDSSNVGACTIRLLSLQHLKFLHRVSVVRDSEEQRKKLCKDFGMVCTVNSIPTAYQLRDGDYTENSTEGLQDALFEAAHELVWNDAAPPFKDVAFKPHQIGNPAIFGKLLRDAKDPVSLYLRGNLNAAQLSFLDNNCCQRSSQALNRMLLQFLWKVQSDSSLWSAERFEKVQLRDRTRQLLDTVQRDSDQLRELNRLLLEEAYPQALDRMQSAHEMTCHWFKRNNLPLKKC